MSIEIKDLSFVYNKDSVFEKKAIDNVNITIENGEFVGLIGHTGSGKSTLIQHLNALVKPTSGKVFIDGVDINENKNTIKKIRQKVGLVFQYPEHQLFEMTIFKDVAFGPKNMGLSDDEISVKVKKALSIVGIDESLHEKSPFELSGGQKRRVAIAGVLAMEPDILILDEPTAGLDPKGRDEILNEIKKMHDTLNITVILVSHSMEDISRLVQRIIVMDNGKVSLQGTPKEVFKEVEKLENIGLGAPQVSYLIKALNEKGFNIEDDIFTVEEISETLYKILCK